MQRVYKLRARRGRKRARIKRADVDAIQIKVPQREEKDENKESECRGYTNQETWNEHPTRVAQTCGTHKRTQN